MSYFLEGCCASLEAVRDAGRIGARRIELCERLDVGGVTPSEVFLRAALAESLMPINVLVRPRGGNFVYSGEEIDAMVECIRLCGRRFGFLRRRLCCRIMNRLTKIRNDYLPCVSR